MEKLLLLAAISACLSCEPDVVVVVGRTAGTRVATQVTGAAILVEGVKIAGPRSLRRQIQEAEDEGDRRQNQVMKELREHNRAVCRAYPHHSRCITIFEAAVRDLRRIIKGR